MIRTLIVLLSLIVSNQVIAESCKRDLKPERRTRRHYSNDARNGTYEGNSREASPYYMDSEDRQSPYRNTDENDTGRETHDLF